jgi:hypothetical protein
LLGTPGDTTVTLSWNAPEDIGGFAITNYYINYTNPTTSVTSNIDAGANTNRLITGLTNGTSIVFTVTAHNGFLTGPGAVVTAGPNLPTTVPGPPGRVPSTTAVGYLIGGDKDIWYIAGNKFYLYGIQYAYLNPNYTNFTTNEPLYEVGVLFAWLAPNNGGLPIDYYNIYVERYGVTTRIGVAALSNEIAGSTQYSFYILRFEYVITTITITAHNANGEGLGRSFSDAYFP